MIHLTAYTAWHWIEDECVSSQSQIWPIFLAVSSRSKARFQIVHKIYPGKRQAFRLDFILWFLQHYPSNLALQKPQNKV